MDNFFAGICYQVKKQNLLGSPTVKLGVYIGKGKGVLQFENDMEHVLNRRWVYSKCPTSGGRKTRRSRKSVRRTRRHR